MSVPCDRKNDCLWSLISILSGALIVVVFLGCEDKIVVKDDTTSPVILQEPQVSAADTCALICWATDEPCTAAVEYKVVGSEQTWRVVSHEFRQRQEIALHPLQPNTDYVFITCSYDAYGNFVFTSEQTFRTAIDTNALLTAGWQAYAARQYHTALAHFQAYRQYKPTALAGLLGMGWTQVRLDSLTVQGIALLNEVRLADPENRDALAGIILGYYNLGNWNMLVIGGEEFFALSPTDYSFQYDPKISSYGIRLMLAEAYHKLGRYTEAHAVLNILLPGNRLAETDSTTWKVGDLEFYYETYEDALGGWIAYLQWNYWSEGIPKKSTYITPFYPALHFFRRARLD